MYEIEKNVPIKEARKGSSKYPFKNMDIGDSFAEIVDGENLREIAGRIGNAANYHGKQIGMKFRVGVQRDKNEVRCWRIE